MAAKTTSIENSGFPDAASYASKSTCPSSLSIQNLCSCKSCSSRVYIFKKQMQLNGKRKKKKLQKQSTASVKRSMKLFFRISLANNAAVTCLCPHKPSWKRTHWTRDFNQKIVALSSAHPAVTEAGTTYGM